RVWGEGPGRGVRRVEVVVEEAQERLALFGTGVHLPGEFGRVGTQQVVEGEPAGRRLGDQVSLHQFGQGRLGRYRRDADEARDGGERDVRARGPAQEPEQPRRRRAQRLVRPGEDAADGGGGVVAA